METLQEKKTPVNLMEGLCNEIDRVKEIVKIYDELPGNAGAFASALMKADIKEAENARNIGDVMAMITSIQKLKEYEL